MKRLLLGLSISFLIAASAIAEDSGKLTYVKLCSGCHDVSGAGRAGLAPALNSSEIVKTDKKQTIDVVVNGRDDTLMVAFKKNMTDKELVAVINYVRQAWGNASDDVTENDVIAAK